MFKKVLIAAVLVSGALWGAGYNLADIKQGISSAADSNADDLTGGTSDWGG
ncbi:hypothetical protein [Altererythrobacter sp. MF3-039]|uniref:hypothetical protein n=1 Tax=Altererythrobacter sp. MF3-039 TaxID=3252901 RepID=UPI00390C5119